MEQSFLWSAAFFYSGGMLALGLVVMIAQTIIILRREDLFSSANILAVFTIPLIIVGCLILVAAGYSSDVLAPLLGFFGTVVGYLIGNKKKSGRSRHKGDSSPPPPQKS